MSDTPPNPPPAATPPVLSYQRKRPHRRSIGPMDFRKIVAIVVLSLIAVGVLYAIIEIIPHPYAGIGIVLFLVLATPAFFLPRHRYLVIATLAILITTAVVILHIRAIRYLEIRNDSHAAIAGLEIMLEDGHHLRILRIGGFPAGVSESTSFLFPGFDGQEITVSGTLSDGRRFGYSPFMRLLGGGGAAAPYHGTTLIVIRPDATVDIENR